MNSDQITNLLTMILCIMIGVLFFLSIVYIVLKIKDKKNKRRLEQDDVSLDSKKEVTADPKQSVEYSKESIFSFMKFDKIEDDMIIRKNGTKYLMIVECQGINYDLMSNVEKNSVEQGFLQFLNTLKHPIQIYTQSRTVNLGASISQYKDILKIIEDRLVKKQMKWLHESNKFRPIKEFQFF